MNRRQLKSLKMEDWPIQDHDLWTQLTSSGDIFDEQGAAGHWSTEYKKQMGYAYGRWLTFIQSRRRHLLTTAHLDRITPETLKDYIDYLTSNVSSESVFVYVSRLYELAKVMSKQIQPKTNPSERWAWFKKLVADLKNRAKPKNKRPRMMDADQIYRLGLKLMDDAVETLLTLKSALQYRDGLIIALLAARPMRRKNITSIVIGQHLTRDGNLFHLSFEAEDVKNRHALEFALPKDLTAFIDRYLASYRPIFRNSNNHQGLWASAKGGPLCAKAITDLTKRHTKKAFGKSINPHLFRDCAATSVAIKSSENVLIAKDILGHTSFETTEKYYIQAQSLEASRDYQNIILARKSESPNTKLKSRQQEP